MDRDREESILEIQAAKPCILLDPITDLLKTLHPEFVLLHSLIELFQVQYGSELPGRLSLSCCLLVYIHIVCLFVYIYYINNRLVPKG